MKTEPDDLTETDLKLFLVNGLSGIVAAVEQADGSLAFYWCSGPDKPPVTILDTEWLSVCALLHNRLRVLDKGVYYTQLAYLVLGKNFVEDLQQLYCQSLVATASWQQQAHALWRTRNGSGFTPAVD